SLHDAIELAKAGTPAGLIATTAFQGLAVSELSALGVAGLALLVIEHPLGGERPDAVARRSQQALEQLASLISGAGRGAEIGRDGARSLGAMPPLWRQATLEKLAINAVMAGGEPAAFPVVLAAVEAMLDPAFNLYGVQATTHPVAPLLVVNGAYGRRLGLHAG